MQQFISTNKLYITDSETEAHTVSIKAITTGKRAYKNSEFISIGKA